MLGNIIAAESIQNDVVIFLPPDACPLDKWSTIIDKTVIFLVSSKEKFLCNIDYGLIDFNDINPGVGKQISEVRGIEPPPRPITRMLSGRSLSNRPAKLMRV